MKNNVPMGYSVKFINTIFIGLFFIQATAQPNKILFTHYTTSDGLSNNQVWSICKDKTGFVWLGTQDGLNRFDGKDFKVFRNSPKNSNTLSHNTVYEVYTDEENTVWAGTFDGLNRYDTRSGEIKRIPFNPQQTSKNVDRLIGAIGENKTDNTLWVGGNGLFKVNKNKNILEAAPGKLNEQHFSRKRSSIRSILIESAERIWLGSNEGFFLYNSVTGEYELFNTPPKKNLPGSDDYFITKIIKAYNGFLWLSTFGAGLMEFDPQKKKFKAIYFPENENDGFKGGKNIVFDIAQTNFENEKTIIWLATNNPSLTAFDIVTHQFKNFATTNPVDKKGIYGSAYSLYFDKRDGLWIGAIKGGYLYDKRMQKFGEHRINRPIINGCLDNIFTICGNRTDSSNNTFWVGTYTCGLYKYNTQTGQHYELPLHIKKQLPTGYSCIYQDIENILWMGSPNNGMFSYNEKTGVVKKHSFSEAGIEDAYYSPKVFFEDSKKQLWIGTKEGIWCLNPQRNQFKKIEWLLPDSLNKKTPKDIVGICEDANANIWFSASYAYDVYYPVIGKISNGTNKANIYYFNTSPVNEIKNIKVITTITCTKKNQLYCASWHGLINWVSNNQPPSFKLLTEENGLLNNFINDIEKDSSDNIWAGTLSGLCKYHPNTNSFIAYTNNGMEKDNITDFTIHAKSGLLLVGDKGGYMYSTNTLDTSTITSSPVITITDVKVFDKRLLLKNETDFNNASITLPYKENVLTIQYAAPDFFNTAFMRYAYKMDGVDKDWVITSNKSITYNLKDGNYSFHVKAMNAEGFWSEETTGLKITIKAPFWKKGWFIILMLLLTVTAIYWLFQLRLRRIKQLFTLRNKIAKDLHDEIGSTLTSIKILSEVSHNNINKNPDKATSLLEKITEQSAQMQQGMSDIVWAISPDNDKLQNLAARMREYIAHTIEPKGIRTDFTIGENVVAKNLSMEQRRDLFLIFKEAVNNIAKYANCSHLQIDIVKNNGGIRMIIKDNGKGFDISKVTTSNGIKNMKARAETLKGNIIINSTTGSGTLVQLDINTT